VSGAEGRRLEGVAKGLRPRERALIRLRWWMDGTEADERLMKYTPEHEKAEVQRLVTAVGRANDEFYRASAVWCEWLHQVDVQMAWLECLAAFRKRTDQLTRAFKTKGVTVREAGRRASRAGGEAVVVDGLPSPRRGFVRETPMLLGTRDPDPEPPTSWREAEARLVGSLKSDVLFRWQELVAMERVMAELCEALGGDFVHADVKSAMEACRAKILDLHAAVQPYSGRFVLPEPEERFLEWAKGLVDWDAIRPAQEGNANPYDPRKYMGEEERRRLEEDEEQWADLLS
jgi:hypothetical protein